MNATPLLKLFFDRKHVAIGDMEASVELRITYDYKQKYIATGVKLKKKQWHDGTVINHPAAPQLNLTLQKIIRNAQEVINEMLDEGCVDIFAIPDRMRRKQAGVVSFIEFCDRRSAERQHNLSADSRQRYDRFHEVQNTSVVSVSESQ